MAITQEIFEYTCICLIWSRYYSDIELQQPKNNKNELEVAMPLFILSQPIPCQADDTEMLDNMMITLIPTQNINLVQKNKPVTWLCSVQNSVLCHKYLDISSKPTHLSSPSALK